MPWRLPEDLKHFKALTTGHPIVMGRKTWESLGRPLPGRLNIVVSRNTGYQAEGATTVTSLTSAIAAAGKVNELFVIGGADVYRLALALADRLQLTELDDEFAGDTHFPEFDRSEWIESARSHHRSEQGLGYSFVTYDRATQST